MKLINDIYKERLTDKLNNKDRYIKFIYCLDNINYCLFYKRYSWYKNGKLHRDDDINGNPQPARIYTYFFGEKSLYFYKTRI